MKKVLTAFGIAVFLFPSVSSAAGLNYQQASSIIVLLQAFGVDSSTINTVWGFIAPADTPLSPPTVATTQNQEPNYQVPITGSQPTYGSVVTVNPAPQAYYDNPGIDTYLTDANQRVSWMQNSIVTTGCTSGLSLPAVTAAQCKYEAQEITTLQADIAQANSLQTSQLTTNCDSGIGEHLTDLMKARDQYYNIEVALANAPTSAVPSLNKQAISEIANVGSIQAEIQANIGVCS